MARETIGDRIQQVREERGMTASDLARLTSVTPTAVWNWEKNGTRPRPNMLSSIAKALGVTKEFLLSGSVEMGVDGSIDQILAQAQRQIAKLNRVEPDRVKVYFQVATE